METWINLPQSLLLKLFETQEHALDNCAAACACSAWHCAVKCSHINSLHLHANGEDSADWAGLMNSRPSLSELQISRQEDLDELEESWLAHIPLTCRSLAIDDYPEDTHLITSCMTRLQELTIGRISQQATARHSVPTWMDLTQLSSLHLVGLECWPDGFPASLKQLHLSAVEHVPTSQALQSLLQLTDLQLRYMDFHFVETGLTCMQNLQSLSLQDCNIWASPADLLKLTWLTSLDLSWSCCIPEEARIPAPCFAVFAAWPLLRVLRVDNCNLFQHKH